MSTDVWSSFISRPSRAASAAKNGRATTVHARTTPSTTPSLSCMSRLRAGSNVTFPAADTVWNTDVVSVWSWMCVTSASMSSASNCACRFTSAAPNSERYGTTSSTSSAKNCGCWAMGPVSGLPCLSLAPVDARLSAGSGANIAVPAGAASLAAHRWRRTPILTRWALTARSLRALALLSRAVAEAPDICLR